MQINLNIRNEKYINYHSALSRLCMNEHHFIFTACKQSLRGLCFHRCPLHAGIHTLTSPPPGQTAPHYMLGYTHRLGKHPPGQTCPRADSPSWAHTPSECWDTVNKRAVRIPLECILVHHYIT